MRPAATSLLLLLMLPAAARAQAPVAGGEPLSVPPLDPALAVTPEVVLKARLAAPEEVTFEEAVKRALEHNTGAQLALEEIARAQALLGQARALALPWLLTAGSFTALDHDRILQGRLVQPGTSWQATATVTAPLIAFSRWYGWAHGAEGVDVSRLSSEDVRRNVAIAAARTYLTVVAAQRGVEVSRSAVSVGRAHQEYALARRKGGVGNELDVKRAEQERWAAEVQLQAANIALARSREALGIVCGARGPLDATRVPGVKSYPDLGQAQGGVEGRADVKAAAGRRDLATAVWKDSWADWMPVLTGSLQGYVQTPAVAPTPPSGWVALLVLTLPIYEGGLRVAQAQEREALAREADTALEGVLRQANSDVRISFEAVRYASAALEAARQGAAAAAATLELANIAYRAGTTTNLDVIDAERRARDAALTAVIAEDAVRQANLDLLSAAGRFP